MSIKSPRQPATKKPGRSIKEKRLIKKSRKAAAENDRMTVFLRGEPGPPASEGMTGWTVRVRRAGRRPVSPAAFSLVPVYELHEVLRVAAR